MSCFAQFNSTIPQGENASRKQHNLLNFNWIEERNTSFPNVFNKTGGGRKHYNSDRPHRGKKNRREGRSRERSPRGETPNGNGWIRSDKWNRKSKRNRRAGRGFVKSIMSKNLRIYPDAFGAINIPSSYNMTCDSFKKKNSGCCLEEFYLGKEDCQYLYVFSISLILIFALFFSIICCGFIGLGVFFIIVIRRRRMMAIKNSNLQAVSVGQIIPATDSTLNNSQIVKNSNMNQMSLVMSNNQNKGVIQQNHRINTNDFQSCDYNRIK